MKDRNFYGNPPKVSHRRGSSAKSARWGGDREDDDDGNGVQGYRAAMKGGRYHYSASIKCDKRN